MVSEAEGWSCFRSSATDTAAPSSYTASSEAACSAYISSLNCLPSSRFYRTNDFSCNLLDDCSLASTQQRQHWSCKYLHRSSFHELENSSAASSVYSSCPSVRCLSSEGEEPCCPPAPPPRRAESFLCVAQHLQQRAEEARQYYSGLLARILLEQRRKTSKQMAAQTEPQAHNGVSSQAAVESDEKPGVTITKLGSSPPNDIFTPTFTPPPPVDSAQESNNLLTARNVINSRTESSKPLMFVYSYDPPTPNRISEYDPPLPNFLLTANKDKIRTGRDTTVIEQKVSNVQNNGRPTSYSSSSTLSATLLLTQDSDVSPLPPHAVRVSPMNSDTLTPSTSQANTAILDPAATYTCTSPAYSNYSDVNFLSTDLSSISLNNFSDVRHTDAPHQKIASPDESEALGGQTPDTICVSPLQSERCTLSHSKTSDEPSLLTQSLSDSQKPSNEGVSDPTTNASSDRARRSSPPSSPDPSLSSLPSDTITMNAAIDSIGTDSDPNDNSTWSTGNVTRDSSSRLSHHETDHASDSAFASPSTSPLFSKSCTITPVLTGRLDSNQENVDGTHDEPVPDQKSALPLAGVNLHFEEQKIEAASEIDFADEATESESIYTESECDIRLLSRADTEGLDSLHRDSSPERATTPIIAEICNFEADSDSSKSFRDASNMLQPHEMHNRTLNEISSSGNSSMSNSPALSSELGVHSSRRLNQKDLPQSSSHNSHLSNWLNENERSYNSTPGYILSLSEDLPDANYPRLLHQSNEFQEGGVLIEELPPETPVSNNMNDVVRNFSYFGPLPTIHEVVDTLTDNTPANEVPPFSPVDAVASSFSSVDVRSDSSIISYLIHSDSPQDVSTTGSSPRSKNTPVPLPTTPPPPPPPPRVKHTFLKTPPLPPPPSDEDVINPHPLPPLPSEEACLPPLPPPPTMSWVPDSPPLIPAHAPTPPQRMYLLIPLAPGLRSPRRMPSPPPAPPRSTSLRRSPPPPPPRSAVQTPSSTVDYMSLDRNGFRMGDITEYDLDDDNRSTSTPSDVGSVICVSKLTPVPEEKSNNSSPLPQTLLVASSENLSICSKGSKSPERRNNTNFKETETSTNYRSRESPQSLSSDTYNFVSYSILPVPSSVVSGSSPPPPTPPRGKINLTPPLPPLPPHPPKLTFTNDSSAYSCHSHPRSDLSINNMKRLDNRENTSSQTPERPAPPPPPPPTFKQTKSPVCAPSLSNQQTEQGQAARASPLLSVSNYGQLVVDRSDIALPPPDEEIGRVFSSGVRWGWLKEGVDTIAMYTQLRPIIQHGPQCGLVALSMASQLCGGSGSSTRRPSISTISGGAVTPNTPSSGGMCGPSSAVSASDLLEAARAAGFSTHGEMFSADCLAQLANQKLGGTIEAVVRKDVLSDKHLFLELILSGALLLVPYDAQHNHQPGRFSGHKAHWGLVSGALVQSVQFASGTCTAAAFARPHPRIDCLWHVRRGYHNNASTPASRPSSRGPSRAGGGDDSRRTAGQQRDIARRDRSSSPASVRSGREGDRQGRSVTPSRGMLAPSAANQAALSAYKQICPDDMLVIPVWRQGKSRHLVSSSLDELCASNSQLTEYPTAESEAGFENDFVIGNVEEGLARKVVVLQRITQPLTTLSELLDKLQTV